MKRAINYCYKKVLVRGFGFFFLSFSMKPILVMKLKNMNKLILWCNNAKDNIAENEISIEILIEIHLNIPMKWIIVNLLN